MTQYGVSWLKDAVAECLKTADPKTCTFYLRSKLHEKDNACCSVVGWVNCNTTRIWVCLSSFSIDSDHHIHQKQ